MQIHRRIQIDCDEGPLWRCLTEPALFPRWLDDFVDETPDDPNKVGVGATSTLRMRENGKVVRYRCLVTEWEPKRRFTVQLSGGSMGPKTVMDVVYELSPGDMSGTTTLDYDLTLPMKGWAWLLTPLVRSYVVAAVKKDLAALAQLAPTVGR